MNSRLPNIWCVIVLVALASAGPVSALAAEPANLPALEQTWHGCVREAFDRQPSHMSKPGRERNALEECKPHEDAYVAALMAARSIDAHHPVLSWVRTWMAYVVDPVTAWIASLRR